MGEHAAEAEVEAEHAAEAKHAARTSTPPRPTPRPSTPPMPSTRRGRARREDKRRFRRWAAALPAISTGSPTSTRVLLVPVKSAGTHNTTSYQ
jgi:hypothetical protein